MPSDLKFAIRSLRSTPGFTAVTLIVLMLGIGATTAIYSIVDAVTLRGMPFERADRLMIVEEVVAADRIGGGYVAAPNFYDWRAQQTSFEALAAFQSKPFTVHDPGRDPEALSAMMVSASLMPLLRVSPILGALFTADHEVAGRNRVALISAGLWQRRYNSDPGILGRTITVGDAAAAAAGVGDNGIWQIVGVMPAGFDFPVGQARPIDVWVPFVPSSNEYPRGDGNSRNYNAQVVGRLKDGVTREQAYAQMAQITANLKTQYPNWFRDNRWVAVVPLHEAVVGRARGWMLLLLGSAGFVLLIACVNVANMLLARSTARSRDVTVRAALGASRWQLARGLLTESLLLSATGTLLGVAVAYWGIEVLRASLPPTLPRLREAGLDVRVLAAAACAALTTGLFFGLLPAIRFSRPHLASSLQGGRSGVTGQARERARSVLLTVEVALAVVLLIGAGLFVSSFVRLVQVDLGMDIDRMLTIRVQPRIDFNSKTLDADRARVATIVEDVFAQVRQMPGIESAALMANGSLPLAGGWSRTVFEIPGQARFTDPALIPDNKSVSAGYFETMRVPVLQGREFTPADQAEGAPAVLIINDMAQQKFFAGENPVGRMVKVNGDRTIVGVVRAVRLGGPESELRPEVFTPASRTSSFGASLVLRTAGDPLLLAPRIRDVVRAALPDVVVPEARTMSSLYSRLIAQRRFNMIVLALFGVLAVVIAAVGIYGVMSYLVAQRTQEIGIRMALGARPRQVLRMVLSRAAFLMGSGLVLGLAGGWMLARLVGTFLFRVEPSDPVVYAGASLLLAAAGLVAAVIPARRAARTDPMSVLK